MIIVKSVQNIPIRLTSERWSHIVQRHPGMKNQKDRVLEAVTNPDLVQEGDFGELLAIKYYEDTPLTAKFLVVIYREIKEIEGFIITSYFTNKPSERREIVWKR